MIKYKYVCIVFNHACKMVRYQTCQYMPMQCDLCPAVSVKRWDQWGWLVIYVMYGIARSLHIGMTGDNQKRDGRCTRGYAVCWQ